MMCDEHEGGRIFAAAKPLQELKEMLARRRVQPGARLVQDQQRRAGHQGAANQQALPLALGKEKPGAVRQGAGTRSGAARACRDGGRAAAISPQKSIMADLPLTMVSRAGSSSGIIWRIGGADQADALAQFAPVGGAVGLGKQFDAAGGGSQIAGQRAEEGGFAGAVGAEDDPVLARARLSRRCCRESARPPVARSGRKRRGSAWIGGSLAVEEGRTASHISPEISSPTNNAEEHVAPETLARSAPHARHEVVEVVFMSSILGHRCSFADTTGVWPVFF